MDAGITFPPKLEVTPDTEKGIWDAPAEVTISLVVEGTSILQS